MLLGVEDIEIKQGKSATEEERPLSLIIKGRTYLNTLAACIELGLTKNGLVYRAKKNNISCIGGRGVGYSEDCFFSLDRLKGSTDASLDDVPGLITLKNFCKKHGVSLSYFTNEKLAGTKSNKLRARRVSFKNSLVIEKEILDLLALDGRRERETEGVK